MSAEYVSLVNYWLVVQYGKAGLLEAWTFVEEVEGIYIARHLGL